MSEQSRPIQTFVETVQMLNRGQFIDAVNKELRETIEALQATPKDEGKATLTIKLTLNYQGGMLNIKPTVTSKLPDPPAFQDTPFWTVDGALSVQHPSQIDMFSRPRALSPSGQDRDIA